SVPTGQVLRIEGTAGSVGNGWELESILIEPAAPIGNLAPVLKEIGDKAVVVSNELSFTVSATDLNNSDDLVLSAAGLPSGAVFNTVTNSGGSVSNTFIWTEASPTGTYSVTFTADDGITNDSETITITVTEEPVLPESVTFDFMGDAALYGALDDQTGPITYTNNGLVATFATVNGEMNRTSSGFGINTSDTTADDTDGFDTNEWIDITFDIPVVLTNVAVGSWNDGADQAVLYVNSVSNGVITTDGNTAFDLIIPALQTLRIAATTNTILDNGWSLDSITVRTDTNAPPVPNTLPIIDPIDDRLLIEGDSVSFSVSASDADLDDIILSASKLPSGASFNTVTNAGAVTNSFTWPAASPAGEYNVTFTADDGTTNVSETVAITVIEQPKLLISEVADPAGSGGGNYRFV
ncbi:MAG TPA: putative Ig domain-containing protein, partial [Tichowtungia sp.]|nr:putative Ig domain-containing protein [Tichowtungia sp.]